MDIIDFSKRIKKKYPDRVPLIIETSIELKESKKKFIVPREITLSQFLFVFRKRMINDFMKEEALYVALKNDKLITLSELVGNVYDKYVHIDGILYLKIYLENVFG